MVCKNCGSELRSDAVFCTECGASISPQPPCVSSIPPPPQMPDLPEMPTAFPPQVLIPGQPPDMPPQEPYMETFTHAPPPQQYGYSPQQQYYQPPQPPYIPVPLSRKKSNTGLIIGLTAGGIVLIILSVIIGISIGRLIGADLYDPWGDPDHLTILTPLPLPLPPERTPTVIPEEAYGLIGIWARDHGDYIWFFGLSPYIEFTSNENGTFYVYESDYEEQRIWFMDLNSNLIVEDEWGGRQVFSYSIAGDRLMIIDSDDDTAYFTRIG